MKWVKASERLPEKDGTYICKTDYITYFLRYIKIKNGVGDTDAIVEWLDETELPIPTDISEWIKDEAEKRYPIDETYKKEGIEKQHLKRQAWNNCGISLYNLLSQQLSDLKRENELHLQRIKEQEEEIKRLNELSERLTNFIHEETVKQKFERK